MKKRIILPIVASLLIMATTVFGSTSYATITSTMTGADGAVYSMSSQVDIYGYNDYDSTNTLWLQLYEQVAGPDRCDWQQEMGISGTGGCYKNVISGNYYIHLDPDGPYYTGCNGFGRVTD